MSTTSYQAAIIGTGQASLPLATYLNSQKIKTVVFEKGKIGGVCVNTGCTPTKTAIASSATAHTVSDSLVYGIKAEEPRTSWVKVRQRVRTIVKESRKNVLEAFEELEHIDLVFGEARFTSSSTLQVDIDKEVTEFTISGEIYVNAGTRPDIPQLEGLEKTPYLTSNSILSVDRLPKKLLIIGAGYIGLEYSQLFRRLGSEVVVLNSGDQLMPKEDPELGNQVQEILEEEGVRFIFNADLKSVSYKQDQFHLRLADKTIKGSDLLIAIGRKSNADKLQATEAGIKLTEKGYIQTDDYLKTNVDHIYALGDIRGKLQYTTVAYDDYRRLKARLAGQPQSIADRTIPYVIFLDPEYGRIGLSEQDAKEKKLAYEVVSIPASRVARFVEMDKTEGTLKAVVDKESKKILGFTAFCERGGELVSMVQIAMEAGLTVDELLQLPFPHPTPAEGLDTLFGELEK